MTRQSNLPRPIVHLWRYEPPKAYLNVRRFSDGLRCDVTGAFILAAGREAARFKLQGRIRRAVDASHLRRVSRFKLDENGVCLIVDNRAPQRRRLPALIAEYEAMQLEQLR